MSFSVIGLSLLSQYVFGDSLSSSSTNMNATMIYSTTMDPSDLNCDRVEYTYERWGDKYTVIKPAGVCRRDDPLFWGSEMLVCDGKNGMSMVSWDNDNCTDDGSEYVRDFREAEYIFEFYNVTSYNVYCCTGNGCPYGVIADYETDTCSQDKTGVDYEDQDPVVIGSCVGEVDTFINIEYDFQKYISCSDGELIYEQHIELTDCSGTASSIKTVKDGDCESTGYQTGIRCGIAMDTCASTTSTPTTISTDSNLNCDRVEYTYEGFGGDMVRKVRPAGVCKRDDPLFWGSEMLVCDGKNGMLMVSWDNDNCVDDGSEYVRDFRDAAYEFTYYNITSYNVYCCTNNACPYGVISDYETDTCSQDKTGVDYEDQDPVIIGSCVGEVDKFMDIEYEFDKYISCSNGKLISELHTDSKDCSGTASSTTTVQDGDCEASGYQTGIRCGIAMNTCGSQYASAQGLMVIVNFAAIICIYFGFM